MRLQGDRTVSGGCVTPGASPPGAPPSAPAAAGPPVRPLCFTRMSKRPTTTISKVFPCENPDELWGWNGPFTRLSGADFIGNDISNVHDNCIEADGGAQNIRTIGNLCISSAADSFSLQPLMGGPAYFIRNVIYNSPFSGGIKWRLNVVFGSHQVLY